MSSTMYHLLAKLHHDQPDVFNFIWIDHVKNILDNTGFSEIWHAESIDTDKFKSCFKQRCIDIYKQDWCSEVQSNSQCTIYNFFKETPEFENYLTDLEPSDRYAICKFRTCTHYSPITKNQFQTSNSSNNAICTLCSQIDVGDELHYVFQCPYFSEERKKLIPSVIQKWT